MKHAEKQVWHTAFLCKGKKPCGGVNLSVLRKELTSRDARARRYLVFARYYWGRPLKFLTLTSVRRSRSNSLALKSFLLALRLLVGDIEYMAAHTDEGRGVYHLAIACKNYIPWQVIRDAWEKRTGATHTYITLEKNFDALLNEMTQQKELCRYSFSREFLPAGARQAIEAVCVHFKGPVRYQAIKMLARRWRRVDALPKTISCIERSPWGRFSYLASRSEVLNGL